MPHPRIPRVLYRQCPVGRILRPAGNALRNRRRPSRHPSAGARARDLDKGVRPVAAIVVHDNPSPSAIGETEEADDEKQNGAGHGADDGAELTGGQSSLVTPVDICIGGCSAVVRCIRGNGTEGDDRGKGHAIPGQGLGDDMGLLPDLKDWGNWCLRRQQHREVSCDLRSRDEVSGDGW